MADFNTFFPKLIKHEGGYVNIAADKGGETYRGISRKFHPTWKGWANVDAIKKKSGTIKRNTVFMELEPLVKSFYKSNFWDKLKGDVIKSQPVAELYVDWGVHSGVSTASKKMAEALKLVGATTINGADNARLYTTLLQLRQKFLNAIAQKPGQEIFAKGWNNRLAAFAKDIPTSTAAVAGIGLGSLIALFFLVTNIGGKNKR